MLMTYAKGSGKGGGAAPTPPGQGSRLNKVLKAGKKAQLKFKTSNKYTIKY